MNSQIYVGVRLQGDSNGQTRTVFQSVTTPTRETCPYVYVIGPFRTLAGAQFMAEYGQGNPHCQHVNDAERLALRIAKESKVAI